MNNIVWKKFVLNDLFVFDSGNQLPFTKKQLDVSDTQNNTYNIAVVTQSERNNGITGYISNDTIDQDKIMKNVIIYSLNFGTCFYQHNDFVLLDTHGSIFRLIAKNEKLKEIIEKDMIVGNFFSKIIMKICKNGVYNYNWKPNSQRAGLEIILVPCIEVENTGDYIWEENDHYYSLAISYIVELMSKVKELKELKTIKKYEAERAKYEAERTKYELGYLKEKKDVIWKCFSISDIFEPTNKMMISKVKKLLDVVNEKDDEHSIAIVGASGFNNGITGWLSDTQSEGKEISNVITISYDAAYSGTAFYQKEKFVTTQNFGTHGALLIKNRYLQTILNEECYQFLCKNLIKIFQKNYCYGWNFKIHGENLLRELIMLPCMEVNNKDKSFWEENDKYYTLATNYISYLFLTGRMNVNQKLIDNYTYQY